MNNTTSSNGGALASDGMTVTIRGGEISNNTATVNGGGVHFSWGGFGTLDGVKVTGNTSGELGGGIFSERAPVTVVNSEISGNTAVAGGGLYFVVDDFNVVNSTIVNNTGSEVGGGVVIHGGENSSTNFYNSIVLFNNSPTGTDIFNIYPTDAHVD